MRFKILEMDKRACMLSGERSQLQPNPLLIKPVSSSKRLDKLREDQQGYAVSISKDDLRES